MVVPEAAGAHTLEEAMSVPFMWGLGTGSVLILTSLLARMDGSYQTTILKKLEATWHSEQSWGVLKELSLTT